MRLKFALVAAMLSAAPFAAEAVPLHQLDIVGNVNPSTSNYTPAGEVDFLGVGTSTSATGIFSPVVTIAESLGSSADPTIFDLFDIEFEEVGPQQIYSGLGFEFWATAFVTFDNIFPTRGFDALGYIITPTGQLPGRFSLSVPSTSSNQVEVSFSSDTTVIPLPASFLLLLSSIMGLGWLSHRRKLATA